MNGPIERTRCTDVVTGRGVFALCMCVVKGRDERASRSAEFDVVVSCTGRVRGRDERASRSAECDVVTSCTGRVRGLMNGRRVRPGVFQQCMSVDSFCGVVIAVWDSV